MGASVKREDIRMRKTALLLGSLLDASPEALVAMNGGPHWFEQEQSGLCGASATLFIRVRGRYPTASLTRRGVGEKGDLVAP